MRGERERFLERLAGFLTKNNVTAVDVVPADGTVVVSLAKDYDLARDRRLWKLPVNRSEPRDVACAGCGQQVVMSNGMFARLEAGEIRRKQIRCLRCAGLAEEKTSP